MQSWRPTKQNQAFMRKSLKDGAKGILMFLVALAVVIFFITYPIVLGVIVGLIVLFIIAATLWTAFGPTQKENDKSGI